MLSTCANLRIAQSTSGLSCWHSATCRPGPLVKPGCSRRLSAPSKSGRSRGRCLNGRIQAAKAEIQEPDVRVDEDSQHHNGARSPLDYAHSRGGPAETSGSSGSADGSSGEADSRKARMMGVAGLVAGLAVLLGAGYAFKGQIRGFVDYFIVVVDNFGPLGLLAYGVVYTLLEVLALPAIPLTMTAGVIFGVVPGTLVVSASSVAAATISFLIARYAARDKVLELAQNNPKFKAIDKAINKQGFKVVVLLRLSPLLPLALSNYLYGLTSVDLTSYVLGSWLGMLPGTIAYVIAGDYGRSVIDNGEGGLAIAPWQVALGVGVTVLALGYIGKVAQKALDDVENDESDSPTQQ
ncbi:hypothetical protein WJX72_009521 [[Myrmecia] bisecta]|uniref:VTT domain-containing protein n=1 Tax=[Myrmecia] bisecta TaxID=41462 RepID=A0AAW1PY60_9CHLO